MQQVLQLELAGRYNSGAMNADGGSLEIVQYNPDNGYAYAVSGVKGTLISVDLNGKLDGDKVVSLTGTEYDVKSLVKGFAYGDMTSVAISPDGSKLAVAIQAPQTSRFADALPEGAKPDDFLPGTEHARYFVVSNGEFLFANKIIGYEEMFSKLGIHLFVNAIEWLMQDEALMGIRNRTLSQMVEKPAPEVQRRIILFNVVGVPAFVLLCMLGIRLHRRHRERQIQRRFAKLK